MPTKLTAEIIAAAIVGFEEQKRRIDSQGSELPAMRSGGRAEADHYAPAPTKPKRRKMSAAGRKAIADAQRKRWAESKSSEEPKPKRKISAAGRKAISDATRRRSWALKRAETKATKTAAKRPAKKVVTKKAAIATAHARRKLAVIGPQSGDKPMMPEPSKLREFALQDTAAWCSQDSASVAAFYLPNGSLSINERFRKPRVESWLRL
jgi:hypothetical protein